MPPDKSQVGGDGSSLAVILKLMLCCELRTSVHCGCWDTPALNHWQLLSSPWCCSTVACFRDQPLRAKGHRMLPSTGIITKLNFPVWSNSGNLIWPCLENNISSISIKSDGGYLHMRCAWTIRNLHIFRTSLGFVMGKHSWNIPWLPGQPATVTKTFVTLAGFFCWPPQTLLPAEINKIWPLLRVTHTSQNIDLLKAAWPAIFQAKLLDFAVSLCCIPWCLLSLSLLLLPWMNRAGQWVLCLSARKVMGKMFWWV